FYNLSHEGGDTLIISDDLWITNTFAFLDGVFETNGFHVGIGFEEDEPPSEDEPPAVTSVSKSNVLHNGGTYGLVIYNGVFDALSGDLDVTNVSLFGGELLAPTGQLSVAGDWIVNGGVFTHDSGTVTFYKSDGVQLLQSGLQSFFNIHHNGSGMLQLSTDSVHLIGAFTNEAGIFDANGMGVRIDGPVTINGGSYIAESGVQRFNNALLVSSGSFVGGTGEVWAGRVTINDTLIAPMGELNVGGDFINNGVFIHNGGTFKYGTYLWQNIGGTSVTTFNNILLFGAMGDSIQNDIIIEGTLTLASGLFEVGPHWVTLYNPIAGITTNFHTDEYSSIRIMGTADSVDLPSSVTELRNLIINNSVGSTLQSMVNVHDSLGIFAGDLHDNGYTLTVSGNVRNNSTHSGGGRIKLAGGLTPHIVYTNGASLFGTVELDDTLGASTSGKLAVHDSLVIQTGSMITGNDTIVLAAGAAMRETMGNTVLGKVRTSSVVHAFVQDNFGEIGFSIIPASTVVAKNVTVTRVTDTMMVGIDGKMSIRRYFDIPLSDSVLVDEMILRYDITERNNQDSASMYLYRSMDNGASWVGEKCDSSFEYQILRHEPSTIHGRWTAADEGNRLALPQFSVVFTEPDSIFRFDTVFVGESVSLAVRFKNEGNSVLVIDSIKSLFSSFIVFGNTYGVCVAPESTATISVLFLSSVAGENTNTIAVYHDDDSTNSPYTLSLRWIAFKRKMPGDADNDNLVTIRDIVPVGIYYLESGEPEPQPTATGEHYLPFRGWEPDSLAEYKARADCNGDGIVDTGDVRVIANRLAATILNDGHEVYEKLFELALGLPPGRFRNDLMAFIDNAKNSSAAVPKEWTLEQNYPNPFNGVSIIRFGVPAQAQTVRLTIYDVLGRAIRTYEQHDVNEGWYNIAWDGADEAGSSVSTGVYYYRLELPVASPIKKILYVR
ncbi:MAG: T9SS type A sorting domain-containing protein, partial [Bacteroidetes bacterium]